MRLYVRLGFVLACFLWLGPLGNGADLMAASTEMNCYWDDECPGYPNAVCLGTWPDKYCESFTNCCNTNWAYVYQWSDYFCGSGQTFHSTNAFFLNLPYPDDGCIVDPGDYSCDYAIPY